MPSSNKSLSCFDSIEAAGHRLMSAIRELKAKRAELDAEAARLGAEVDHLYALRLEPQCHLSGCDCNGSEGA